MIAWIAAQPWCTGKVGLMGISWGGFNSLQVAARRPPALKAIVTVCSTDDRYTEDCHYMGGCLLGSDMLNWASIMFAYNALPPNPAVVGDRWRELWFQRLEGAPPFIESWVSHQRRILETGIGGRGVRGDQLPGLRGRGGWTRTRILCPAC